MHACMQTSISIFFPSYFGNPTGALILSYIYYTASCNGILLVSLCVYDSLTNLYSRLILLSGLCA